MVLRRARAAGAIMIRVPPDGSGTPHDARRSIHLRIMLSVVSARLSLATATGMLTRPRNASRVITVDSTGAESMADILNRASTAIREAQLHASTSNDMDGLGIAL